MKTLRPRVKIYLISLLVLTILFLAVCMPLFLSGYLSSADISIIVITAFISHLIASLPFSLTMFSMPVNNTRPVRTANNKTPCTLYVGNLLYRTKRDDLIEIFCKFGEVLSARIILDKDSRKSKGYGFVEMAESDAAAAIAALNGSDFNGRALRVNEAKGR